MKILICGASGFLGQHLERHLLQAGHTLVRGQRQPQRPGDLCINFTHTGQIQAWAKQLTGFDVVINAVGILVESEQARFSDLHQRGPQDLFAACLAAGVGRVVQISALGAAQGDTAYFRSKRAADEYLMHLPLQWQIVRPSLVYGADGRSAGFLRQLASLPLIALPAGGQQALQPIHVDDLCAAITTLINPATPHGQCVDLVGPAQMTLRELLLYLGRGMGLPSACSINIPAGLMRCTARVAGHLPGSLLTPDTWAMLQAGNVAHAQATQTLLGHAPRAMESFITPTDAPALRLQALAAWRNPLLRLVLALVWLATGLISLLVYPVSDSLALLARTGLGGTAAYLALYGAVALDLALGWATLVKPGRRLWMGQMVLISAYSGVIALCLPEYLSHPFGPILKNLPMLALLTVLLSEETAP